MKYYNKNNQGFTLIELIVTVAIIGILADMGMPSLQTTVQDNRMAALYNEFLGSASYTRSAAITFGSAVTLCRRNSAGDACDTQSTDFSNGWLVFHDKDGDGTIDAGERILKDNSIGASDITMEFTGNTNRITYNAEGFARGYSGKVTFCDKRGDSAKKGMIISMNGRIRKADSQDTLSSCSSE